MTNDRILKIQQVFEQHYPVVKTCILRENKICSRDIMELITEGYVIKIKTGYYAWKSIIDELKDIELAYSVIPKGIISMLSAAQIHDLIRFNTVDTYVTIPNKMIKPTLPLLPKIHLFYSSANYFGLGMIKYKMKNMEIKVYNPERTVCDLFKYTDKIENELALEALRSYMIRIDKDIELLLEYASLLRVKKYIRPYVEMLI